MHFARWTFLLAGVYGLIVLVPMFALETQIGIDNPPPITHPEYFYGFLFVAIAWQIAFLIIGLDPMRYRLMMLPAVVEKLGYGVATLLLFLTGRLMLIVIVFGMIDMALGALFVLAFRKTKAMH